MTDYRRVAEVLICGIGVDVDPEEWYAALEHAARLCEREALVEVLLTRVLFTAGAPSGLQHAAQQVREFCLESGSKHPA